MNAASVAMGGWFFFNLAASGLTACGFFGAFTTGRERAVCTVAGLLLFWIGASGSFYMDAACTPAACADFSVGMLVRATVLGASCALLAAVVLWLSPWHRLHRTTAENKLLSFVRNVLVGIVVAGCTLGVIYLVLQALNAFGAWIVDTLNLPMGSDPSHWVVWIILTMTGWLSLSAIVCLIWVLHRIGRFALDALGFVRRPSRTDEPPLTADSRCSREGEEKTDGI